MANESYRIERDSLGEVRVPEQALFMAQTQRAFENFPISVCPLVEPSFVLGIVKSAAAAVNRELDCSTRRAEVASGQHDADFPSTFF